MNYQFREENLGTLFEDYGKIKIKSCIVCNNKDFEFWAKSGPYEAFKCGDCGLIFMSPQLNEEGLTEYYTNYIGKRRLSNEKKMQLRTIQYTLDAELIKKFIRKGKVLDVGCNGGFFLDAMGDGFQRYGTELDSQAIGYAKANFPSFSNNLKNGTLHSAQFEDEYFDLVMMRGVIEHVSNPEESIKEISRILKKGGYYFICATPNGQSLLADLYREDWTLFHPVQHIWHFSPENLSKLCQPYGLKLYWKEFPYLGTPYENVKKNIEEIANFITRKNKAISPPFYENMMSLVFKKD